MSMVGLRPNISARLPDRGKMAVLERAYAEPTHVKSSPPLRSLVIVGRAVATAVKSRALRRVDKRTARKVNQNAAPLPVLAGGVMAVASSAAMISEGEGGAIGWFFGCGGDHGRVTSLYRRVVQIEV